MDFLKACTLVLCTMFLFGCASGAKQQNMVYTPSQSIEYDNALHNAVDFDTTSGGEETNPLWTSEIGDKEFSGALMQTLINEGLYSPDGQYKLNVMFLGVNQPMFGLDFDVMTSIRYELIDAKSGQSIFAETVDANYTATISDAFIAIERLRLANEGSAKQNIKGFLEKLSELKVSSHQISSIKLSQ